MSGNNNNIITFQAGASGPKKAETIYRKPLPRPQPRTFSIPSLARIGSRKLEGKDNVFLWKPYTIRAPFLILLILVTASLLVVIELMVQKQQKDGALLFAPNNGNLSAWQVFVSQYAATIIAVIYAILLGLIDFDVKRLEPYFQLSKPNGVLGKNSLCLKYPVEFLAFVPFSALKRKHWSVFCIGTSMVFTFWALTPLQSALLSNSAVQRSFVFTGSVASGLRPAEPTPAVFLFNTYAQSWLGSGDREFTTRDYAVLPFNIPNNETFSEKDTWDGISTVYYADVDCEPAKRIDYPENKPNPLSGSSTPYPYRAWIAPQRNCTFGHTGFATPLPDFRQYFGLWAGYSSRTAATYYLQNSKICNLTASEANIFLFLFSKRKSEKDQNPPVTATYCTTKYISQKAQVSVAAQVPHTVKNVQLLGKPQPLRYQEFNSTFFENIINNNGGDSAIATGPFSSAPYEISYSAAIRKKLALFSENPAIPYVISEQQNLDALMHREEQIKAIRKAYKRLFANYVAAHLISGTAQPVNVTQTSTLDAVIVVPRIGRILESFLGAVFILLVVLLYLENKRELNLLSDPASITHTMSLVSESRDLLDDFEGLDRANSDEVEAALKQVTYRLGRWKDNKYRLDRMCNTQVAPYQPKQGIGNENLVHGLELRQMVGIGFVFLIAAVIVLLSVLFRSNVVHQGLPTLSNNHFVVQIIFSFIPTALATIMEPFWVLLCRRFAMLQPFSNLANRNSAPASSISLKFTSVPPPLVFSSAFKSKHFFLGTVASMCLIANILAVSLGGLFNLNTSSYTSQDVVLAQNYSTAISSVPKIVTDADSDITMDKEGSKTIVVGSTDHHYVGWTNATDGTPLPPWVSSKYFFLPFTAKDAVRRGSIVSGRTVGYGVEASCKPSTKPKVSFQANPVIGSGNEDININLNYTLFDAATSQKCSGYWVSSKGCTDCGPGGTTFHPFNTSRAKVAREAYPFLNTTDPNGIQAGCTKYFMGMWVHSTVVNGSDSEAAVEVESVICEAKLVSGDFEVKIDGDSRILDYTLQGELKYDDSTKLNNSLKPVDMVAAYSSLLRGIDLGRSDVVNTAAHTRAVVKDWNTLWITHFLKSTDIVDPSKPLPDGQALSTAMKKMFEFLFPIVLGANYQRMFKTAPVRDVQGAVLTLTERMEMSTVMFGISIGILIVYLFVAMYIYALRTAPFLPRYPNSMGSIVAFFYGSKALSDVVGTELLSTRQRNGVLERTGHSYGYGLFKGRDNTIRLGIEREPLLGIPHQPTKTSKGGSWKIWQV